MGTTLLHPALPVRAEVHPDGVLALGGCRTTDLARRFGTPLYIYDARSLRMAMHDAVAAMGTAGTVHYAGKAYLARWLLDMVVAQGLGLDVCSGTELEIALAAEFPPSRIRFHGNNKQLDALRRGIRLPIGAIVVDSLPELDTLIAEASREQCRAPVLLRLNPGIEAHTHRYLQTGILDSKFGLPIATGAAAAAVQYALAHPQQIDLLGYHAHLGTQILELEPYRLLVGVLLRFATEMHETRGYWPVQISPGGGIGITYTDEVPPTLAAWLGALREEVGTAPALPVPHLGVEPGRAIVGRAGVALYTVGSVKRVPGVRTFVNVDGGMADNIRPALYGAAYAALAANRMTDQCTEMATIAGPYCESGDLLVHDAPVPSLSPGDLVALPAVGAYCLPMSSNYNGALRPAVVVVEDGRVRLVQRRQTTADLLSLDLAGGDEP